MFSVKILGSMVALAFGLAPAHSAEHTLNIGFMTAKMSSYAAFVDELPGRIEAATGGKLKIELYDTLVSGPDQPAAVRHGTLDGAVVLNPYISGETPYLNYTALPGLIWDYGEYKHVLDAVVREEMEKIWLARYNAEQLATGLFEWQIIISKTPLHRISDFEGKKVRVHNVEAAEMLKRVGVAPTAIAYSEIVPALQRDIVDAVITGAGSALSMGFDEVAGHVSHWRIGTLVPWSFIINKDRWAELPDDIKAAVTKEMQAMETEHFATVADISRDRIAQLVAKGMKFHEPDEAALGEFFSEENISSVYEAWYGRTEATGSNGRDLVARIRAAQESYRSKDE